MMEKLEFTKEIKNAWLNALKSGKFKQGAGELMNHRDGYKAHCCLGVLCEVHPRLSLDITDNGKEAYDELLDGERIYNKNEGWPIIKQLLSISPQQFYEIYNTNDHYSDGKYTSVIPLIEKIPTVD